MGKMSAGTYLRVMRERRDISRAEIAKVIKASVQTVANIETGGKEPAASKLLAFVQAVGASLEDVQRLMLASDNEVEAYRLADIQLARLSERSERAIREHVTGYGRDELEQIRSAIANDPGFLDVI